METHEQITTWLKDAHAMEQNLENVLRRHIDDAQDFPALRERLKRHLDETLEQAERIRECLESLGTQPSAAKSLAGSVLGSIEGMSTRMFADEIVKNALADYAMEHFEIACYSSLLAAAEEAGLDAVASVVRENLAEEQLMADWFRTHIPQLTRTYLDQVAARPQ